MSVNKKNEGHQTEYVPLDEQHIVNVEINREMKKSFLDYSMSVIIERALPDVRDGLKPVHRRILYTMYENNLYPEKAYRKCADTVGSVLGRYHPHGDASVYDAMVRLAQDFSMRYPLVDGHGNFGSIDGDPAAAYRYTESRLTKMSMNMITNIDKETVDWMSNYDDRLKEPTVLTSRFPNLLVNGSTGIAVGMATNMPPHNLREIVDGINLLVENPEAELSEIMDYIKGPDFPTAGIIMGRSGIRSAYATGRGKITLRARTEIVENEKRGRFEIHITELPYQVNKARLAQQIADEAKEKRIEGIADVQDYSSDRAGMNLVVMLKRDANPQVVLNQLFSFTQLQITFGIINLAIVDGEPKVLTLKELLKNYIAFQKEIITRRTRFDLKKAMDRKHVLDGLARAIDIVDEIIATIRACKGGTSEAKTAIMEKFDFDDPQASAIVAFRLGQLAGLEIQKIHAEMDELKAKIEEFNEILSSEEKLNEIFLTELNEIKDKYGDDRRTELETVSGEVDIEDLIPNIESVFTLTEMGYIKRQELSEYRAQRRGGRGVKGLTRREDDTTRIMMTTMSHDSILFFSNFGKAYLLKGYQVPEGSRTSKGMNIVNVLPLESEEQITALLKVPSEDLEKYYLTMATKFGIIKRTKLDAFKNIRKNGIYAMNLDEDDKLLFVEITDGTKNLMLATKNGKAIALNEESIRAVGRTARGVRAMRLSEGDILSGMCVLDDSRKVLTVSKTGFGRLSEVSEYRIQGRGGKGLINYKTEKYGEVAAVRTATDEDDVIMISSDGIIIRMPVNSINTVSRTSKGVKVMKTAENEFVSAVSVVPHEEDEETELSENVTEISTEDITE